MSLNFNLTALYDLPAAPPPPGYPPTWTKDEYQTIVGKVDISICLIVATIAFTLRMYTKIKIMKYFVLEDYVFVFAYVFYFIFSVICYIVDRQGVFHLYNLHVKDVAFYLWWLRFATIIYGITIAGIKIMILLQYLRMFAPTKQVRGMYWTCHISIWIHLIFYVVFVAMVIFRCRPMRKMLDPILLVSPEGTCINEVHIAIGSGIFNVISDFLLLLLPQHTIWTLKLSRNKKIGVSGLFGVGVIACAAAIARLYLSAMMTHNPDHIRSYIQQGLATLPECVCGILVAALPVAPRFVQHVKEAWSGTQVRSLPPADQSDSGESGLWQKPPTRFASGKTMSQSSTPMTGARTLSSAEQSSPKECEKHIESVDKQELDPFEEFSPARDREPRPFSWTETTRPLESRQMRSMRNTWIV